MFRLFRKQTPDASNKDHTTKTIAIVLQSDSDIKPPQ